MFYGLGAYYFGKGVEEFARPFAIALAVVGAIVVVSLIVYWRRKEQELAAAAERAIPGAVADRTVPRGRWVVPAKTSTACVKPLSVEWIASCAVASGSEYRDAACQLLLNFADGTVADLRASKLDV
jgi:hypothetical protein